MPDAAAACRYLLVQAGEEQHAPRPLPQSSRSSAWAKPSSAKFVAPNFRRFGDASRPIAKGDYVNAFVGNNIVVEGLAICLLELGCKDMRANSDEIGNSSTSSWRTSAITCVSANAVCASGTNRARERTRRDRLLRRDVGYVQGAIDEIPDVIASLGLEPKALLVEAKTFFEARFAAAGLAVTA